MIIFDLRCQPAGHVFEAWFGSSADYEDQQGRGLVSCPLCGAATIEKAPMAPAVPRKGDGALPQPAPEPAVVKEMLGTLAALQRRMVKQSDWVGDRFADEARAIHFGETDARSIHGRATRKDAESLAEDGIGFVPLIFPLAPPDQEN